MILVRNLVAVCIGALAGKAVREKDWYNIVFSVTAGIAYIAFIIMYE